MSLLKKTTPVEVADAVGEVDAFSTGFLHTIFQGTEFQKPLQLPACSGLMLHQNRGRYRSIRKNLWKNWEFQS